MALDDIFDFCAQKNNAESLTRRYDVIFTAVLTLFFRQSIASDHSERSAINSHCNLFLARFYSQCDVFLRDGNSV
jgi:hypothetical protein